MTDKPELQQALEDLNHGFEEYKDTMEIALKERALKGDVDVLITEKIERLNEEIEKRTELLDSAAKQVDGMMTRMDELETAQQRSGVGSNQSPEEELQTRSDACSMILADHYERGRPLDLNASEIEAPDLEAFGAYNRHYTSYLRRGQDRFFRDAGFDDIETRLLSVDRDPGGGYWVTPAMSGRIMTIIRETSPVRKFATVESISTDSLELLVDENQADFGWVAEEDSRDETATPDIGKRVINVHEMYAEPRATQKLLDDAGFNVEAWLSGKVAERFARAEATAFVVGTGVGQPRGLATYASGTSAGQIEQINSGTSGAVTSDGLYDLVYSLKGPYLRNARFMAARLTIRDIRKLKDGEGRYLWEPNQQVGQPQSLLGYAVTQADDLAAIAGGSLSIAWGDFKAAYTVVDRIGIRTLRDPFTAKPYIKLYTTKRVGGAVTNFEAIKLQVMT